MASNEENKQEIIRIAEIHEARLIDQQKSHLLFEITDEFEKIDRFLKLLEPFGILDLSRTGSAALQL